MPSPAGYFVGFPLDTLQRMQEIATERAIKGSVTSESAGAKSEGKVYDMPVAQALQEITYAIQKATNTVPPRNVVQILIGGRRNGHNGGLL